MGGSGGGAISDSLTIKCTTGYSHFEKENNLPYSTAFYRRVFS